MTAANKTHHPRPHRFAVIGGDGRMTHVAERLSEAGHAVDLLGCGGDCLPCEASGGPIRLVATPERAAERATTLILPLPASRDGETVWCPRDLACTVRLETLCDLLDRRPDLRLFGGRLPTDLLARYPGRAVDYYASEELQLRNAAVTAEGALMTAMQLTDRAIRGMTVAIIGYGRIGKLLARLLLALGAEVSVAARREEALLWAATDGCHPLRMGDPTRPGGGLYPLCFGHSVIFNTVPARVLDRDLLTRMEHGTLLIDLASAPFGVADEDIREAAATTGLRYVRAPSLPGTYAPREAGRIIAECILGTLRREEHAKGGDGA